jgi:hypothetical protein
LKKAAWPLAVVVLVALATAATAASKAPERASNARAGKGSSAVYIVRMLEQPVTAYEGGVAGLKATKPAKGKKINPNDPDVVKYAAYLGEKHSAAASKVGAAKLYDYQYVFNGFAAQLSPGQVAQLESDPAVLTVAKSELQHIDTSNTIDYMGMTGGSGAWSKLGGVGKAGEDMIIGVVDTGIVSDSHPSFSDRTGAGPNGQDGKLDYQQIPGWHGKCTPGEGWTAEDCGQKLIGARFYTAGFGLEDIAERDFLSPRDWNGHGSHTASTAGGNTGVQATGDASSLGKVSGMAPRARIAAYKVCWEDEGDGGCNSADSVAAIDQAVADGVDVINFSISGTRTNYLDPVEVAFLFAADAGVFVASSAGNDGPGNFTVAHVSPWVAAVAAGVHSRRGQGSVVLGNGTSVSGASLTNALASKKLVRSRDIPAAGQSANDAALCFPGSLDAAKAAGAIVFCDRGTSALVEKVQVAKAAGAVGAIIGNVAGGGTNTLGLLHALPTVHLDLARADQVRAYITSAGAAATASLTAAVVTNDNPLAGTVASFSSRGPSIAGGEDIMKPDFMAPGEDILAAVAPEGNSGRDFDLYSGTSMSSPHVAGFGALLKQAHPGWSPAMIRSALSTTADPAGGNLFNVGAGLVSPTKAFDPGLVYNAGFNDYLRFLAGQRLIGGTGIDASDLNQPSIAIGGVAGTQTVTRTVTNVSSASETYTSALTTPAGFTAVVTPSSFTIAPGATQTYTVAFTRTTATFGSRFAGQLVWNGDKGHSARSPIIVSAAAVAAPAQITGTGTSGSTSWEIKTGFANPLNFAKRGLIPAATVTDTVTDDPTNNFGTTNPDANQGIKVHDVVVPAGTTYARFSLFDAETDGADDLDLYVYRVNADATKTLVGVSGSGTSAEEVNLIAPAAATYKVYVHGWQTDGADATYTLFSWVLGTADAGNMTVSSPTAVATVGGTATVNLSWTGLTAGRKYLGAVGYLENSTERGSSIIRIDG